MDTEAFGGGDSQHPRGVVSIRIHTEEQLENNTKSFVLPSGSLRGASYC